jgi:hypothetical protein
MSNYTEYEIMKANWIRKNPNATAQQYQEAMRERLLKGAEFK